MSEAVDAYLRANIDLGKRLGVERVLVHAGLHQSSELELRNKASLEHLRREKVAFSQRRANGQALFQLFLYDPNGIKIELNYAAEEAEGITPELMASDLIAQR